MTCLSYKTPLVFQWKQANMTNSPTPTKDFPHFFANCLTYSSHPTKYKLSTPVPTHNIHILTFLYNEFSGDNTTVRLCVFEWWGVCFADDKYFMYSM